MNDQGFSIAYGIDFAEWLVSLRAAARAAGWSREVEDVGVFVEVAELATPASTPSMRVTIGGESFVVHGRHPCRAVKLALGGVNETRRYRTLTDTGRVRSTGPNLQNFPVTFTAEDRASGPLRRAQRAVSSLADYATIEKRVSEHLAAAVQRRPESD